MVGQKCPVTAADLEQSLNGVSCPFAVACVGGPCRLGAWRRKRETAPCSPRPPDERRRHVLAHAVTSLCGPFKRENSKVAPNM